MGMQSFCQWAWRMGWRYVVAGASLLMVVLVAANLTDEAEILRTPLIIGCVSGLVLVLSVPTQMPKSESEWFKTLGSLGGVVKTVRGW